MRKISKLQHRFVEGFPEKLEPGIFYIALDFATMSHLCCCGCGQEVITPLSPHDWKITFDGENITVHPSIGNWSLTCRSHYFIRKNHVQWAADWSDEQIREGREQDHITKRGNSNIVHAPDTPHEREQISQTTSIWSQIKSWLLKK